MFNKITEKITKEKFLDYLAYGFCIFIFISSLILGHLHKVGDFGVETDFYGAYAPQAENILEGKPYTYMHNPPGYMVILAFTSILTNDTFSASKILTSIATVLFGFITYRLFKKLFGIEVAFSSLILLLLTLLPYSFLAAMDIVGALFMIIPVYYFLNKSSLNVKAAIITGLLTGLSYMIRYNSLFIVLGFLIIIIILNISNHSVKERIIYSGYFLLGAFIITSPWLVINWSKNGSPFASTAYLQIAAHFYHELGDSFATSLRESYSKFSSIQDVIFYNPIMFIEKYLKGVLYYNLIDLIKGVLKFPLFLFAGAGSLLIVTSRSKKLFAFVIINLLGYLLLGLVGFYLRYYFFLFPFIFLLVTYFFFHKEFYKLQGNLLIGKINLSWIIIIIFAVIISVRSANHISKFINSEPRYLVEISDEIKKFSKPNEKIISRKPHLAYLSGLERIFPLVNTPEEYLFEAKLSKARFIIYSEVEAEIWPALKTFAEPQNLPKEFRLIYKHEHSNTLLYEIDLSYP